MSLTTKGVENVKVETPDLFVKVEIAQNPMHSKLIMAGNDVSHCVKRIEIDIDVNGESKITLTVPFIEVKGEILDLFVKPIESQCLT